MRLLHVVSPIEHSGGRHTPPSEVGVQRPPHRIRFSSEQYGGLGIGVNVFVGRGITVVVGVGVERSTPQQKPVRLNGSPGSVHGPERPGYRPASSHV